ncbi:hypothetical protein DPMN_024265 [Dreissena polymorpha]|uniref:Uncharacterized protein n=1 Tax=Dreissena polymorpha TaxID=45954 RepID=A0A9D4LMM6_DREPO|nr:hypothetical protein DPMN_024265 [Dreissena polymorpha]
MASWSPIPGMVSHLLMRVMLFVKKTSRMLLVYSVIRVGDWTTWSSDASLAIDRSCLHWVLFLACGLGHSFSQSISGRLKSPPSHRWAFLGILVRMALSSSRYSGSVDEGGL